MLALQSIPRSQWPRSPNVARSITLLAIIAFKNRISHTDLMQRVGQNIEDEKVFEIHRLAN